MKIAPGPAEQIAPNEIAGAGPAGGSVSIEVQVADQMQKAPTPDAAFTHLVESKLQTGPQSGHAREMADFMQMDPVIAQRQAEGKPSIDSVDVPTGLAAGITLEDDGPSAFDKSRDKAAEMWNAEPKAQVQEPAPNKPGEVSFGGSGSEWSASQMVGAQAEQKTKAASTNAQGEVKYGGKEDWNASQMVGARSEKVTKDPVEGVQAGVSYGGKEDWSASQMVGARSEKMTKDPVEGVQAGVSYGGKEDWSASQMVGARSEKVAKEPVAGAQAGVSYGGKEDWNASQMVGARGEQKPKQAKTNPQEGVQFGGSGSEWKASSMVAGEKPEKETKDPVAGVQANVSYGGSGNEWSASQMVGAQAERKPKAASANAQENVKYGGSGSNWKAEQMIGDQGDGKTGERFKEAAARGTEAVRAGAEKVDGVIDAVGDRVVEGVRHEQNAAREQAAFTKEQLRNAKVRAREVAGNVAEKLVRTVEVPEGFPTKAERKAHAEFVKSIRNNPEQIQKALEARLSSGELRLVEETGPRGVLKGYRVEGGQVRLTARYATTAPVEYLDAAAVTDTMLGAAARGVHLRSRVAKGEVSPAEQQLGNVKARLEAGDAYVQMKGGKVIFRGADGKRLPISMTPHEAKQQGLLEAYGVANAQAEAGMAEAVAEAPEGAQVATPEAGEAAPVAEAGEGATSAQTGERASAEAAHSGAAETAGEVAPDSTEQPAPSIEMASPILEKFSMDRLKEYSVEELNEIITALENNLNKINAGLELAQKMEEENDALEGDPRLAQFITGLKQAKEAQTTALEKVAERRNELVAEQQEQNEKEAQVEEALAEAEEKAEAGTLTMEDVIGLMGEMGGGIGGAEQNFSKMMSWLARVMALMSRIAQSV